MKSSQLRIFVSSTFVDLQETREEVLKFLSVLKSDLISMEIFGSDEQGSLEVCLSGVKQCNFFIGIYAERYGSIDTESGLSLTELEYHEAYSKLQQGTLKGLLLYVLDAEANWPIKYVDRDASAIEKMSAFKSLIGNRHTLTNFKDSAELPFNILRDTIRKLELSVEETYKPRITPSLPEQQRFERPIGMGFFSPELAPFFYGRVVEIQELSTQLIQYRFSLLIGVSGIGKTSLLNAGVIPQLKRIGWLIATSRPLNDPLNNLRKSIWNQLIDAPLPEAFGLDDVIRTILTVHPRKKVLLIIDQFDDILNDKDEQEISRIIQSLNQLYQLQHPDLHLLISYRGDLESEIGIIWQKISGAADGLPRYYLSPLGPQNSRKILLYTLSSLDIEMEDAALLEEINEDILRESDNNGHLGVFPPFIQMVIATIHANLKENIFSRKAYQELYRSKGMISNYLYSQLAYLGADKENGIRFLVTLVSNYGTKTQKSIEEISREMALSDSALQPILSKLLDLRLIRPLEIGFEITHDLLARTILNGLMTDEEKDIRRFKYLLESKAQAFASTSSILSYAEHLHIYKYRKRITCNELELKLLAASSQENRLPFAYWLTAENLKIPKGIELARLEVSVQALKRLDPAYVEPVSDHMLDMEDETPEPDFKKLAAKNTEYAIFTFFEKAIRFLQPDSGYQFSDRARFKNMLGAITLAKFGQEDELKALLHWQAEGKLDPKQKYIAMRSVIFLIRRLGILIPAAQLYTYEGKFGSSVVEDLNAACVQDGDLDHIFSLIKAHEQNAPYVDYLVALLSRVIKPNEHSMVLDYIQHRARNRSWEQLYDKYLILALQLGANFSYFMELLKNAVNALNVKYTTMLHQRIAELATEADFPMLSDFIAHLITLKKAYPYDDPTGGLMKRSDNQYLYTWVIACAYVRFVGKEQIPVLIELLYNGFYTVRKAAYFRLLTIATEEDLRSLLNKIPETKKYEEYTDLLFMLDCKINLLDQYDRIWADNNLETDFFSAIDIYSLLPRGYGDPVDPEKASQMTSNYHPDEIPTYADLMRKMENNDGQAN